MSPRLPEATAPPLHRLFYALVFGLGVVSCVAILIAQYYLTQPAAGVLGTPAQPAQLPGLHWDKGAWAALLAVCAALLLLAAWMVLLFWRLLRSFKTMHRAALTDHLTGVANRAALTELLETPPAQQALRDGTFALITLDLDHFKRLNDRYGHQVGDTALKVAAARITTALPDGKHVFRMGGDEFLCVVIDPNPARAAQEIVERLRAVFGLPMDLGGNRQVITPSIGVATAHKGEAWEQVLSRSDSAMYRAKHGNSVTKASA